MVAKAFDWLKNWKYLKSFSSEPLDGMKKFHVKRKRAIAI
jgi:hypothetical protein